MTTKERDVQVKNGINVFELEDRMMQIADSSSRVQSMPLSALHSGASNIGNPSAPLILSRSVSYGSSGGSASEAQSDGASQKSTRMKPYAELRSHEQIRALEAHYEYDQVLCPGGEEDSSECSIATSLFVEVASVDEEGSYIGYGGCTPDESEVDDANSTPTGPVTGPSTANSAMGREGDKSFSIGSSDYEDKSLSSLSYRKREFTSPSEFASGEFFRGDFATNMGLYKSPFSSSETSIGQIIPSSHVMHQHQPGDQHNSIKTGDMDTTSTSTSVAVPRSSSSFGDIHSNSSAKSSSNRGSLSGSYKGKSILPRTMLVREDGYDGASEMGANNDDVDMVDEEISQEATRVGLVLSPDLIDNEHSNSQLELLGGDLKSTRRSQEVTEKSKTILQPDRQASCILSPISVNSLDSSGKSRDSREKQFATSNGITPSHHDHTTNTNSTTLFTSTRTIPCNNTSANLSTSNGLPEDQKQECSTDTSNSKQRTGYKDSLSSTASSVPSQLNDTFSEGDLTKLLERFIERQEDQLEASPH